MNARLAICVAALIMSTAGVAIKFSKLPALVLVGSRSAIAAVTIVTYLLWRRTRPRFTPRLYVGVIGFALTVTGFVLAHRMTTALNAIFLISTAPVFAALGARIVLGERISRRTVVGLALLTCGGAVVLWSAATAASFAGECIAIGVALCWGVVIVVMRAEGVRTGEPAGLWMFAFGNVLAAAVALSLASAGISMDGPSWDAASWREWVLVGYLGVFQLGTAFIMIEHGGRRLAAAEVATLLLLEPIVNPVLTYAVLGESPTGFAVAGAVVMLVALLFSSTGSRHRVAEYR